MGSRVDFTEVTGKQGDQQMIERGQETSRCKENGSEDGKSVAGLRFGGIPRQGMAGMASA